ncbi:MAG: hypothetical protein CTY29_08330 [Methylobacter sp.]|nr:MAG: hypothetical protein CTY29_08330 [Methylobacter sp.]
MRKVIIQSLVFAGLLGFTQVSTAHIGVLPTSGWADGLMHPFSGIDHLLVMIGVGLWAGSQRRQPAWWIIGLFLAAMVVGALLGMQGVVLHSVESAVLATLIAVGLLLAAGNNRIWQPLGLAIVAVSALLHGLAHGAEMPETAEAFTYIVGIVSATGILHGLGMAGSFCLRRMQADVWVGIYGGATGLAGAWLLITA